MPQKRRMECFRPLLEHLAWIEHQFSSGIRVAGSLWGMMRGVGGVRKSIHQSWLAKGFGLGIGLLCWGFKKRHSSNQVSVISTRTMHQSITPSLSQTIWPRWASRQFLSLPIVQTLLPATFGYSLSSEAVVIRQLRRWKVIDTLRQEDFHGVFQKLLKRYNVCIVAGGDYFDGDESFMCVLSIKVPIRKKSGNLFNDPCILYRSE